MAGEQGPQRLSTLVSRVSFEPLSEAVVFPGNGSLSRDGSGASVESTSEYDSWRVSCRLARPRPRRPRACSQHQPAGTLSRCCAQEPSWRR